LGSFELAGLTVLEDPTVHTHSREMVRKNVDAQYLLPVWVVDIAQKLTGCKAISVKPRLSIGDKIKLIGIALFVSESVDL
jgi:hypothetical protein